MYSKGHHAEHVGVEQELGKAEDAARALLLLDKAVLHADRKTIAIRVKAIKQAFSTVLTKANAATLTQDGRPETSEAVSIPPGDTRTVRP